MEFQQKFTEVKENIKGLSNKVKYEKENERERKQESNKKEEKNLNQKDLNKDTEQKENINEKELTKENIEKELGDKYVVSAEINDEEISKKLIETEGFIGNPLIAFNKETKEFVLIGNQGDGELKEANLYRTSTTVNVDKYNFDGSIVEEKSIQGMILLPPQNNDGIDLRLNEYGQIEINKIVNARGDNPQMFPIDTKQRIPSTQEIEEMKQNGEGMEELIEIIDEMQGKNIINEEERTEILEDLSTNGKTLAEDKEMLEDIEKKKKESVKEQIEEEDEYDPRDPRAKDPRWQ